MLAKIYSAYCKRRLRIGRLFELVFLCSNFAVACVRWQDYKSVKVICLKILKRNTLVLDTCLFLLIIRLYC